MKEDSMAEILPEERKQLGREGTYDFIIFVDRIK